MSLRQAQNIRQFKGERLLPRDDDLEKKSWLKKLKNELQKLCKIKLDKIWQSMIVYASRVGQDDDKMNIDK